MRNLATLALAFTLVACGAGDRPEVGPTTSTRQPATTTSSTTPSSQTATTEPNPTTVAEENDDPGVESVGVTDKVTIIITDPDD